MAEPSWTGWLIGISDSPLPGHRAIIPQSAATTHIGPLYQPPALSRAVRRMTGRCP